ncbi:MAG TPA: hypothetical protein VKD22_00105 [Ramlibacter sp.]|nr:hypothetical protein [Ramlibacter sp.]
MNVTPILTDRVSYWGALWYPAQMVWKVFVYAMYAIFIGLFTLFSTAAWLFATKALYILLIALGTAMLPIQIEQDVWFGFATDVGNEVGIIADNILAIVEDLIECAQPFLNFLNQPIRFVLGIINVITDGALFPWARNVARGERYLRQLEVERELERIAPIFYREAQVAVGNMTDPAMQLMYLQSIYKTMRQRAEVRVRREMGAEERYSVIPSVLCDIIAAFFNFLIDLLTIVGTAVEDFVKLLLNFFNGDGFDASFLFIFVQFIAKEILSQIPFTQCFINPDDLATATSPEQILQLFEDQTPKRLISCICPWAYDNPLHFPCVIHPCDVVPSNPGTAIIKCICFLPGANIQTDDDPIDAAKKCTGFYELLALFQSFYNYVQDVVLAAVNGLITAYNYLYGQFQSLLSDFQNLLDDFSSLQDALPRDMPTRNPEVEAERKARHAAMREKWANVLMPESVRNAITRLPVLLNETAVMLESSQRGAQRRREFARSLDTDIRGAPPSREAMERMQRVATSSVIMAIGLGRQMADQMRAFSVRGNATAKMRESLAERVRTVPESQFLRDFAENVTATYGPEAGEPTRRILNGVRALAETLVWSILAPPGEATVPRIADRLRDAGLREAIPAVGALARHIRMTRGETQLDRDLRDAGDSAALWSARYFGGEAEYRRMAARMRQGRGEPDIGDRDAWIKEIVEETKAEIAATRQRRGEAAPFTQLLHERHRRDLATAIDPGEVLGRGWGYASDTFRVEVADQWRDWKSEVQLSWERAHFSWSAPVDTSERFLVVAIAIVGGAATVGVALFGFSIGVGLTFLATIGVALIGPILLFMSLFFLPIFEMVIDAAVNNVLNTVQTQTRYHDFFTPKILIFLDLVAQSFTDGYQLADLQTALSDVGDSLLQDLNWIAAFQIRRVMCRWPLPAPPYTCPPLPLVDDKGEMIGTVWDWFTDIIFFNQDATCASYDDCIGHGRCRCSINPADSNEWRQRDGTPDVPCIDGSLNAVGKCTSWPLLPEGLYLPSIQLQINIDPQCEAEYGYSISKIRYFDGPEFQKYFTTPGAQKWRYFFTAEFFNNLWGGFSIWVASARFLLRRIIYGATISWSGLAFFIVGALFFVPGLAVVGIPILTFAANSLTPFLNNVGTWLIDFSSAHTGTVLVGPLFSHALLWARFPNYAAYPPFGKPEAGDWLCFIADLPSTLIVTGLIIILIPFVFGAALFAIWALFFTLDVLLFPVWYAIYILSLVIHTTILARRNIINLAPGATRFLTGATRFVGGSMPRAVFRVRADTPMPPHVAARLPPSAFVAGAHPVLSEFGITPHSRPARVGDMMVVRRTEADERRVLPWTTAVLRACQAVAESATVHGALTPMFFWQVFRRRPTLVRASKGPEQPELSRTHRPVVMDHSVDPAHYQTFPWARFVPSGCGTGLDGSPHHAVIFEETYHQKRPYDHRDYEYFAHGE